MNVNDLPAREESVVVAWDTETGRHALVFEPLTTVDQWLRREYRDDGDGWDPAGAEHVDELAVENARAAAE
jgi:hypothetical protein